MLSALLMLLTLPAFAGDEPVPVRAEVSASFLPAVRPIKVLALDADQTLRISTTQWRAPRKPSEVVILPGVREKIAEFNRRGYYIAIFSNQRNPVGDSGLELVEETMKETIRLIEACGARIDYYDFSLEEREDKPGTVMIDRLEKGLQRKFGLNATIDHRQSIMVGDAAYKSDEARPDGRIGFDTANFDREFAENNRFQFREPQDFFGWSRYGMDRIENLKALREYEGHAGRTPVGCP